MSFHFVLSLFWIYLLQGECAILEKTDSVCNGPCSNLLMQCPPAHKIAIREALYGVHPTSSSCPYTADCLDRRPECCDMAPGRDCLFPYPLGHLEAFHRNCSGQLQCSITTEQTPEASSSCSPLEHRNISSYSFFDYVCVNDTFTADLCSPQTVSLRNRTLFALFDARRQTPPPPGSICACAATPTSWSGNGRVSAFVVDMRLHQPQTSSCSNSVLEMEAQPKFHEITCMASQDPYFPYPFVSILNSTEGAMARLIINETPPEFVWIGFEASQDEEIQLTCGLQPKPTPPPHLVPKPTTDTHDHDHDHDHVHHAAAAPQPNKKSIQPVIIASGIIGGILIIVLIVLIIVWLQRKRIARKKDPPHYYNGEDHLYSDVDGESTSRRRNQAVAIEPMYQTVGGSAATDVYSSPWDSRKNRKFKDNQAFVPDDDSDDASDMYVTSDEVRKNKKKRSSKPPEDTLAGEYVSPSEIRKKKKKEKRVTFNKNLEEYDRLNYNRRSSEGVPPGYSHLGMCKISDGDDNNATNKEDKPEEIDTTLKPPPGDVDTKPSEPVETDTDIDTSLREPPALKGGEELSGEDVEMEEIYKRMNFADTDDEDTSETSSSSDDSNEDSGLSTDDEKAQPADETEQERTTLSVPEITDTGPSSPSPYALAKSFSTGY